MGHSGCQAVAAAERALAADYPDRAVVLTDSGTTALFLALKLVARGCSQEPPTVALPAFACPDIAASAVAAGFRIFLYDQDPGSLEPDWESVERLARAGLTACVVTHLFGRIIDLGIAKTLASTFGFELIEDAAQHAGGSIAGRRAGAQCRYGVLSFGRGKGLNAGGGGALVHDGPVPPAIIEYLSGAAAGRSVAVRALVSEFLSHPLLYGIPARLPWFGIGTTQYHVLSHPRLMSARNAFLLSLALKEESDSLRHRREISAYYRERLIADRESGVTAFTADAHGGCLRFPVLLDRRRRGVAESLRPMGVSRSYPRTLAQYPEFIDRVVNASSALPGAALLADGTYTLPTHSRVSHATAATITGRIQAST